MATTDDESFQRELDAELRSKPSWGNSRYPTTPNVAERGGGADFIPKNAQTLRLYLKKYGFIMKLLCMLDFVFAVFRCFTPNAFWLGAGVVFAPMGLFGALRFKRAFVFAYAAYCLIEVILTVVFTFLYVHDKTQTAFFLSSAIGEAVVFYYVWRFFRAIPVDEVIRV